MRVFACIAHRGNPSFLRLLHENVKTYLRPWWSCVFSQAPLRAANTTVFLETEDASRHGTFAVLSRYVRCFDFVVLNKLNSSPYDALVFVASNQIFFKECSLTHKTFSFTPTLVTLYNNVLNPFRTPVGYPSHAWRRVMLSYSNRATRTLSPLARSGVLLPKQSQDSGSRFLFRKIVTHAEGSFYTMRQLSDAHPIYEAAHRLALLDARLNHSSPADWLLSTVVGNTSSMPEVMQYARPNLCARLCLEENVKLDQIHQLQSSLHPWYCCFKIPGSENLLL